jgi:type IV pilus assembly protein PilB
MGASDPAPAEHTLTASDLVSALLARAQGADVSDVLPNRDWETLFATLLRLLIKKGLIADWEFVGELEKLRGD